MTENEFWKEKHTLLAKQFNLTIEQITTIRSLAIGFHATRGSIVGWSKNKLSQNRCEKGKSNKGRRKYSKEYYKKIVDFVSKVSWEDWKELIFEYRYQK